MKKFWVVMLAIGWVLMHTVVINAQNDDLVTLVEGNNTFAFDLYQQVTATSDGNLIFSPYSISSAFAMLYAGADGITAEELANVFHFELSPERLHPAFADLAARLDVPEVADDQLQDLTLNIANSLWGQEGLSFDPTFVDLLNKTYGAGFFPVDFIADPSGTHETIRQWISDATEERITDMPSQQAITPDTRLVLANAIYFKAAWSSSFFEDGTVNEAFQTLDEETVTVPMMSNFDGFKGCLLSDDFTAVELAYGASETASMLVIIPDAGAFQQVEQNLNPAFLAEVQAGLEFTSTLTFQMPRFDTESTLDLEAALHEMGLTSAFSDAANFSNLSSTPLFLDSAQHKATISIDENGTEAAAVTVLSMGVTSMPPPSSCGDTITADRPFIYVIYEHATNSILFMGRVTNPTE